MKKLTRNPKRVIHHRNSGQFARRNGARLHRRQVKSTARKRRRNHLSSAAPLAATAIEEAPVSGNGEPTGVRRRGRRRHGSVVASAAGGDGVRAAARGHGGTSVEKEVVGEVTRGRNHHRREGGGGVGGGGGSGRVSRVGWTRMRAFGWGSGSEEPDLANLRDGVDHGAWSSPRRIHRVS